MSRPMMMCGLTYMTIIATVMFLCGFFTWTWIREAHDGLNYSTTFMNQVSADWESPPLQELSLS